MTHPTATDLESARADLVDAAREYERAAEEHSGSIRSGDEVRTITAMKVMSDRLVSRALAAAAVMQSAAVTVRRLYSEHADAAEKAIDLDSRISEIDDLLKQARERAR